MMTPRSSCPGGEVLLSGAQTSGSLQNQYFSLANLAQQAARTGAVITFTGGGLRTLQGPDWREFRHA